MKVNTTIIPEVTLIVEVPNNKHRYLQYIEVNYLDKEIGVIWWSNRGKCICSVEIDNPTKDPIMAVFTALIHNQEKIGKWLEEDED